MNRMLTSLVLSATLAVPAAAQSVNVDLGRGAGIPVPSYAGAGLPGVWNGVAAGPGVTVPLVGLRGRPTAVTLSRNLGSIMSFNDPGTTGNEETLLDDGVSGLGDVVSTVRFEGLVSGRYEATVYAWTPGQPTDTTYVMIHNNLGPGFIVGGPWPGKLESGITHATGAGTVVDGTFDVQFAGGTFGHTGFLNGIQLRRLTAADVNGDGIVDVVDLLAVLGHWGPCPPGGPCTGDVNLDGVVDLLDLLEVLAEWG